MTSFQFYLRKKIIEKPIEHVLKKCFRKLKSFALKKKLPKIAKKKDDASDVEKVGLALG